MLRARPKACGRPSRHAPRTARALFGGSGTDWPSDKCGHAHVWIVHRGAAEA